MRKGLVSERRYRIEPKKRGPNNPLPREVVDQIVSAAAAGKTVRETAAALGLTYIQVHNYGKKLQLTFARERRAKSPTLTDAPAKPSPVREPGSPGDWAARKTHARW